MSLLPLFLGKIKTYYFISYQHFFSTKSNLLCTKISTLWVPSSKFNMIKQRRMNMLMVCIKFLSSGFWYLCSNTNQNRCQRKPCSWYCTLKHLLTAQTDAHTVLESQLDWKKKKNCLRRSVRFQNTFKQKNRGTKLCSRAGLFGCVLSENKKKT
jgi:hypothetical protein